MKFLKIALVVSGILLSFQSIAKQVVSIYVSNHAIYLTYGDASERTPMAALQGSTANPMLAKDVASWGTNDSPIKTFQVILTTLENTKQFKIIKNDLKSKTKKDVSVRIFAAGSDGPLNSESVKLTIQKDNIFEKEFHNDPEVKDILSKPGIRKWAAHPVLFKVAMSKAFGFDFPLPVASSDSDFVIDVAKMESCNSVLWATTYSAVHVLGSNPGKTEISSELPRSLQTPATGGTFGFGKAVIYSMMQVPNYKVESNFAYFCETLFDRYKKSSPMKDFPSTQDDLIDRFTHPETPLGFVNAGEIALDFLTVGAPDTDVGRDPLYIEALRYAKAAMNSAQTKSFADELENTKRIVTENAVKKYLIAIWLKAKETKTKDQGILLGEYSKGIFDDEISLGSYLGNDDFMRSVAQSLESLQNSQEKIPRSDLIRAIRERFSDKKHSLIVIPQERLLEYLHLVGSTCAQ